jgi:DNA-binding NtrC family response regulator
MKSDHQGPPKAHILLVEDDPAVRNGLREYLSASGFEISEADTCAAAQTLFQTVRIDIAIMDFHLPDGNAIHLVTAFKALDRDVPIVVLTGHGSIELAVRTIQAGAEQFLTKPVDLASLRVVIEKCLEHGRNRRQVAGDQVGQARQAHDPFLGTSAAIRALELQALRVVKSNAPVLILGETGAGKGVLARWMHVNGPRSREPYVDLNCAGLARELIESELFGHEKGAFTGATTAKAGLIEVAHRGTVFLDEIGDMDLAVQPKLLKVLEEKRFRRVGDVRERTVDVRFIAAANQDLARRAEEKTFRQDLLYRINTVTLHVPALRERREDIPVLASTILESLARDMPHGKRTLTPAAVQALQAYPWPGNARELRNALEHAVLLTDGPTIDVDALGLSGRRRPLAEPMPTVAAVASSDPPSSGDLTLRAAEIQEITRALQAEGGRVERAAQRLGVPRSSLYQKIRKYGIAIPKA